MTKEEIEFIDNKINDITSLLYGSYFVSNTHYLYRNNIYTKVIERVVKSKDFYKDNSFFSFGRRMSFNCFDVLGFTFVIKQIFIQDNKIKIIYETHILEYNLKTLL